MIKFVFLTSLFFVVACGTTYDEQDVDEIDKSNLVVSTNDDDMSNRGAIKEFLESADLGKDLNVPMPAPVMQCLLGAGQFYMDLNNYNNGHQPSGSGTNYIRSLKATGNYKFDVIFERPPVFSEVDIQGVFDNAINDKFVEIVAKYDFVKVVGFPAECASYITPTRYGISLKEYDDGWRISSIREI